MDDWQLLQDYATRGSEATFRVLVQRHIGLIHSVARRQVRDSQLAEDVTQAVLVLLARKAGSFGRNVVLPSWLFRTTRFVASRAVRSELRRQQREREACEMQFFQSVETPRPALVPLLDEALARLREQDRSVVLLRFAHEQSLREVGAQLGVSEEAAKKRANRALQQLRSFFAHRGYKVSVTILAGILSEHLAEAVPAELTARMATTVIAAGHTGGALMPPLAREVINAWRWGKFKVAGALAASVAGLIWLGAVLSPQGQSSHNAAANGDGSGRSRPELARASNIGQKAQPTRLRQRSLSFHVISQDTREPVGNAPLAVNTVSEQGWRQRFDLVTDEHGTAEVLYPATASRLDVGVVASGWAARFATWHTDSDPALPTDYTLAVVPVTNWMSGRLNDEKGLPVANAIIEMEFSASDMAQQENPRERPGFVSSAPVTGSDNSGWWTCAVVDRKARRIPGLRARHPDFAPTRIDSGSYAQNPEAVQDRTTNLLWTGKLITTMNQAVKLTGRVVTEDGRPVPGAQLDHDPGSVERLHSESDTDGWFALEGLGRGEFDFFTTAPGFAQDYQKISLTEGMPPLEVRLKPGGLLRLRVLDEEGAAVSDASIVLTSPLGVYEPGGLNWSGVSGSNGYLEWTSAPTHQTLRLCASKHPEFRMSRGIAVKADGEEHVIRLARTFCVSGYVTDAQTGEPVNELKAFPGYGRGDFCWYRGELRHGMNGRFEVYFTEDNFPWRARVEAEGYAPFISGELSPDASRRLDMDIVLQRADPLRTVRGIVLRTDGKPAADAEVALLSPEHDANLAGARFSDSDHYGDKLVVKTDSAGTFAFPEERNAHTAIAVCSNGFARVAVRDTKQSLEIHLQPWGRIEGTIDPSARRRPVRYVIADDLLAMDSPGHMRLDHQFYNVQPGASDQFVFEFLPPGRLCVWLDAGVIEHDQTPYHHPTWIPVSVGETARPIIAESGYRVKGRFVRPQDGWAGFTPSAVLDADSTFESTRAVGSDFLGTKFWVRSFFDPGRLIIAPDGSFESLNPILPGSYHLLLSLGRTRYEQDITVPNPDENPFESHRFFSEPGEAAVINLGEISFAEKSSKRD